MKHLLLTTIAAVVLVGCGPSVDIHQAAEEGNIEAVKQAIADGADVNALGGLMQQTPLDYAEGETADLLRTHGGKTSLWLRAGESIHIAAAAGHIEAVKQYLADGVDVNVRDEDGSTPLSDAVFWAAFSADASAGSSNGHKETAELLIEKGANVNARNDRGWTPLDFALNLKHGGAIADFLRKHGAKTERELNNVLIDAGKKGDIEAVKQHLAAGTDVNGEGRRGSTVLHNAAAAGHKEITQLLIAKGADVNAKNPSGRTPLDFVSNIKINNRDEIADLLRKHGGKTREELNSEGK